MANHPSDGLPPEMFSPGVDLDAETDIAANDEDMPYELREETPVTETSEIGLISEKHDLTSRDAAFLVSSRESSVVMRSPLFYATAIVVALLTLGSVIAGINAAQQDSQGGSDAVLATVGLGQNAPAAEQQLGVKIKDTDSLEAAEKLVRTGKADAALVQDPTGAKPPQLLVMHSEPKAITKALRPELAISYLDEPPVKSAVATALVWGLALLLVASTLTLGAAAYTHVRVERRSRLAEIMAAAVPSKSIVWGKVAGLSFLGTIHVLIVGVILTLGLSIASFTGLVGSMLPGLGIFAAFFVVAHFVILPFFIAAACVGETQRKIYLLGFGAVVVVGALLPMLFAPESQVNQILSFIPFTSPIAMPMRMFAGLAPLWAVPLSLVLMMLLAVVAFIGATSRFGPSVLKTSGRGGKTADTKRLHSTKSAKNS